ncbi:hypothetical protein OC846_003539 [Tilletia horrida]|uniref:Expansin-like EG45 domain-containing protein n=1 Tax=Tilletia horrida TaxID=155126 RepID=A0AAN6GS01_9BASI|nr:hypothetical protein OC846_003539 [Tilletia horrida]
MTHYDLPSRYVAACGCVQSAPTMPSAALNVLAFGSETSFGPSCGLCAKLTLISTPLAAISEDSADGSSSLAGDPNPGDAGIAFSQEEQDDGTAPSIVVKIVDSCPRGPPWCNATVDGPNSLGSFVHFDLAWPSVAIPSTFFPGTHDYGVWNVSYEFTSCSAWRGFNNPRVVGSDWIQQDSACCPKNPPLPSDPNFNNTIWESQESTRGMPLGCPNYADTLLANPAMVPNTSNPLSKHDHDGPAPGSGGGASEAGAACTSLRPPPLSMESSLAALAFWSLSMTASISMGLLSLSAP